MDDGEINDLDKALAQAFQINSKKDKVQRQEEFRIFRRYIFRIEITLILI